MTITVMSTNELDFSINENYDVVKTTLGHLRKKLNETKSKKAYPNIEQQYFDIDSTFNTVIYRMLLVEEGDNINISSNPFSEMKPIFNDKNKLVQAIKEELIYKTKPLSKKLKSAYETYFQLYQDNFGKRKGEVFSDKLKDENAYIDFRFLLSSTLIDIEVDNEGNWYLLDGFRRVMLSGEELDNHTILIRKFNQLSHQQWMKYMLCANNWKVKDEYDIVKFLDRGVLYSIYLRTGIIVPTFPYHFPSYNRNLIQNLFSMTSKYSSDFINDTLSLVNYYKNDYKKAFNEDISVNTPKEEWESHLMNPQFVNDIDFITKLITLCKENSKMNLYTGKKKTEIKEKVEIPREFLDMVIATIGEARKYEMANNLESKELKHEEYLNVLKELLDEQDCVKAARKINNNISKGYFEMKEVIREYILSNLFSYDPVEVIEKTPIVKLFTFDKNNQ